MNKTNNSSPIASAVGGRDERIGKELVRCGAITPEQLRKIMTLPEECE